MTRPHSKSRRGLLTLIGFAALPVTPVAAQPAIRIEGGVPQRLPLTTIRDLDIASRRRSTRTRSTLRCSTSAWSTFRAAG